MTIAVVVLMMAFVIPTFRDALSDLEVPIVGLTKAVYDASDFLLSYWRIIIVIVIVLGGSIFGFSRTNAGKKVFDIFKIKCPVIGKITINLITARFARAFGLLLSSGMDLTTAFHTISIVLGNVYVEEKFNEAAEDVRHGVTLTNALQKQGLFPQILIQMVSVGEKTASLEEVFGRSCKFFDEQVETSLSSLTSKIQPIMLLIMGVVIGMLFLAVYSPMLAIMDKLA